jgi:DNA-binding response OmpR family regulator
MKAELLGVCFPHGTPNHVRQRGRIASASDSPGERRNGPSVSGTGGLSVLIVEDDQVVRGLLREFLTIEHCAVIEAGNAWHARRLARSHLPDVIVLDIMLPWKSGLDVLRDLRAHGATGAIPVIMASSSSDLLSEQEVRGADAFVQKPYDLDELFARMREVTSRARMEAQAPLNNTTQN